MLRQQHLGQPERLQRVPGAVPGGPLPQGAGRQLDLGHLEGLLQRGPRHPSHRHLGGHLLRR